MSNKSKQPILVGIIIVLAVALIYSIATRDDNKKNSEYGNLSNPNESNTNEPVAMENNTATNNPTPGATPAAPVTATPNYMTPQLPATITEDQKAELKAGSEDHQPKELTFNITGGSFYFTPNEIKVKQGDKVKIIFTNVGGMHNLILPDFKVETKTIQTNESDTIEFTANKKGTFEFYCAVGKGYHRLMGQIGVLLVE
ncbi:MAG: cupredoxin domain-containing protein [Candidatus Falkowbacteria bacterium]